MSLYVNNFNGGAATSVTFNLFGIRDGFAGENFMEGSGETGLASGSTTPPSPLAYVNAPGVDDSSDGTTNSTTIFANGDASLATFTATLSDLNQTISIPDNPSLRAFLNADTNNLASFLITRNTTGNAANDSVLNTTFATGESATAAFRPTLTVVPEPSRARATASLRCGRSPDAAQAEVRPQAV